MRTRRSNYPNNSNVTIPRRRRRQVSNIVEPEIRTIVAPMAERTMEELLRAPTEGYGEAIVLPEINADHFEIKDENFLLSLMNVTSSKTDERIDKLADQLSTLVEIVSKKVVTPAPVKAVEESCVTCGGAHSWYNCPATNNNQASVCATTAFSACYTPIGMTLELADRSITYPKGLVEDVFVKVGKFHFPTDFVVVDFEADPRDFLILRGGNPTPTFEPFTSEFILEEIEAYLKDDSISPEIDHADCNPEEDICLIEKLLNNDPFQLPPMDLKQSEMTKAKSSIEEPPELELKDLSSP
ncbi:hypothetical protein Tco_0823737 [Tanacetum coccineum]|uniref:Reverse transcriptase domain-containing protein n=1 Tax=Tanacetum coccineum TaxID=301880 RepID=A0ABQ5AN61_9ASTR